MVPGGLRCATLCGATFKGVARWSICSKEGSGEKTPPTLSESDASGALASLSGSVTADGPDAPSS